MDGACYVPAGWFVAGGGDQPSGLGRTRLWCDGFHLAATPVTVREFIRFLDDLVATGREDEALRHLPREGLQLGHTA